MFNYIILFLFFFLSFFPAINVENNRLVDNMKKIKQSLHSFKKNKKIRRRKVPKKSNKKLKKRLDNKIVNNIENSVKTASYENNLENNSNILSDILGIYIIDGVESFHLFNYINLFFEDFIQNSRDPKVTKILKLIISDIGALTELLNIFIERENINADKVLSYIKDENIDFYNSYFFKGQASYLSNNDYRLEISETNYNSIVSFFSDLNNVKIDTLNQEEIKNHEVFSYYKNFFYNAIKSNLIKKSSEVGFNTVKISKNNDFNIVSDYKLVNYLNQLFFSINSDSNKYIFSNLFNTYLYFLFIKYGFIEKKLLAEQVKKTLFHKEELQKALELCHNAFKKSELIIEKLWSIVFKNKNLLADIPSYKNIEKDIENIDSLGGIIKCIENKIAFQIKPPSSLIDKINNFGLIKSIGVGTALAGAAYLSYKAAGSENGSMKNLLIDSFAKMKDSVVSLFSQRTSAEVIGKAATTNFVSEGFNYLVETPIKYVGNKIGSLLPESLTSKGLGAFAVGVSSLYLNEKAKDIIVNNVVKPVANKIGREVLDFNVYDFTKNKIKKYFMDVNTYYIYSLGISDKRCINESLIISKLINPIGLIVRLMAIVNNKSTEVISEMEKYIKRHAKNNLYAAEYQKDFIKNAESHLGERISEVKNQEIQLKKEIDELKREKNIFEEERKQFEKQKVF